MFYEEITKVSAQMQRDYPELTFEYVFIDDGSKDRTLSTLRTMSRWDRRVRYISFSRNFGKEAGIYAGLSDAKGDYCVVMDADLQHPPAFLPTMYEAVRNGEYDCATTRRVSRRGESKVRSWFARLFYRIMNKISQTEIVDGAQDFRFMTRQMVDAVLSMSEYNRFSKGIFSWVGFRVKYIEYENVERAAGTTAWSFWGLFRYSIEGIIGFSTFPLSLSVFLGLLSCFIAFVMFLVTVIKKLAFGDPVAGYPTLICTLVFFGGLQLFCTGILGLYLSKTYLEVKKRPIFIMRENEQNRDTFPEPPAPEKAKTPEKKAAVRRPAPVKKTAPAKAAPEEAPLPEETAEEMLDDIMEETFAEEPAAEPAVSPEKSRKPTVKELAEFAAARLREPEETDREPASDADGAEEASEEPQDAAPYGGDAAEAEDTAGMCPEEDAAELPEYDDAAEADDGDLFPDDEVSDDGDMDSDDGDEKPVSIMDRLRSMFSGFRIRDSAAEYAEDEYDEDDDEYDDDYEDYDGDEKAGWDDEEDDSGYRGAHYSSDDDEDDL